MSELTRKTSAGMWAEENRRRRSSSDSSESSSSSSSKVKLPSVRALASRFNSLAQHEGIVVKGGVRPSAGGQPPVKVPKPTPAPVKTKPPTAKVVESKIQKSSASSTNAAPPPPKPPVASSKPRVSVTTDTDDDVFESKKTPTTPEAPAHFPKKSPTRDSRQKTGFSSLPSKSTTKKWSSLSDLHAADSSPKQRSDSVSSMTIFGVSLRRLDSKSWGVTQARRSTAGDDSSSSSDEDSRTTTPDFDKTDSGSKFDTFPKHRPVESAPDKKRSGGGGVKSKISQKMVNKEDVKYHSYSDLSTAGVDTGATWPRRIAVGGDSPNPPHQILTRRQSISDLLKLYRSKSQSDLSQAADSKPPPSPKFETFSRPKTPVPTAPLTMYDLKISNPMEKTKVSPYKPPTKDIVRLPPGAVSFTPKKPPLVLAPVPSKDTSLKNNTAVDKSTVQVAPIPIKQAPAQLEKPATKIATPVVTKSPTAKQAPGTPKPSPASSSVSTTGVKTTVNKTLSSSSSSSDSSSQAAPESKQVITQVITPPKVVYLPPPKHFNRPIYSQTPSVTRPKETAVQKPEQKPKTSSIQSLSRMYTPLSYGKNTASAPNNSVAKPDQSQSSSSSDDETNSKSMDQKNPETKPPVKAVWSVTSLINTLNDMKAKPTFPVKPDVLKPKPQDPIWVQKVSPVSQSSVSLSRESNNTNTKAGSDSLNDRNKLGRKDSSTSSASADSADGIPHDEKTSSFIAAAPTGVPTPKKRSFQNIPFIPTPPNTPLGKSVSKPNKLDKLSVEDSLNSWVKEVNKKDSSSSGESSDEDDKTPEETTGSYDFTTGHSGPSKLPTSRVNDVKKEGTVPNVVLIKHKPIVDKNSAPSQSGKKENDKQSLSAVVKLESNGESLPATVSVRKAIRKVERQFSSSSDDGPEKRQSKLPTPVPNNQRQQPVHQQNNIDHQSKKIVTFNPVEKTSSKSLYSRQDSVNRKSVSSENSSSGETSASEPFKEIDPYAIGRMIVRGSRKSDSVVKKPENLTNIRNASVPSHSPFSPLKSPTRKIDSSVTTTSPKPKLQKKDSSSDDGKIPPKPQARSTNSSNDEQGSYKMTKTKRGNFIRQSLSASSDFDSSDGEKGGLELSIGHDSDHGDGVYSANVAFIE